MTSRMPDSALSVALTAGRSWRVISRAFSYRLSALSSQLAFSDTSQAACFELIVQRLIAENWLG